MNKYKNIYTLLLLLCSSSLIWSQVALNEEAATVIPDERRIEWSPGIPDGIPEITGPVYNVLDYGADPTGVVDSRSAITQAISALPTDGGVVYIPEGNYRINSKVSIQRNNVVIRGSGRFTRLMSYANGDCFEVITYQRGTWQTLAGGTTKGNLTLTVPDGSAFTPGKFAEIEQTNDPALMYTDPLWDVDWAEQSVGQLLEVESVDGNVLTFTLPFNYDFTTVLDAQIRPQGFITGVGFEDFYLEKMVANGNNILLKNTAYCWVDNVESYHTRKVHVDQNTTLGNEIRNSHFHRSFSYGGGGSGYGVGCGMHVTNALVENNIFDSLRHAMIIQVGANGNVYGYNYSINPVQGDGETNLNQGWDPPDISIHGHYPYMNLFEGNEVVEIGIGDYWGPAGPGNTYYRNRVSGEGIIYHDASHKQNNLGNITTRFKDSGGPALEKLEHGNKVNWTVIWDPTIADHDLPVSYYLDVVPEFFGEMNWPVFGPDTDAANKLPAQVRFENLPYLDVVPEATTVEKYKKLEFTIDNGKSYTNPFDPDEVDISGLFISPSDDSMTINAFWDGSAWKLRFAGDESGQWTYTISVSDEEGSDRQSGSFSVNESQEHGWIRPSDQDNHYLMLDDGTPFYGIGMAVPWLVYDDRYYEQPGLLSRLNGYGVNFINWLFTSWDILLIRDNYNSYSMADAEAFDLLIEDAEEQGIKLLLGIWIHDLIRDTPHPWSGFYDWSSNPFNQLSSVDEFFSDATSWEWQEKYYRYIIARWGYSQSVGMWHTVAEINGTNAIYDPFAMLNDERGWHNKINSFFQENDPFHHPTTVSGSGGNDFGPGWEVTDVPQVHEYPWPPENLKENTDRIAYWSNLLHSRYNKPALVGEFGKSVYEEDKSETFLHNSLWAGLMSGVASTPLHWWGGQIAVQPENFSTFNETMLLQLTYLDAFVEEIDMSAHGFTPLYSAPSETAPILSGMTDGMVYGLSGDTLHLGWVQHVSETSSQLFSGVNLSFPGMTIGWYIVDFYDTWSGQWLTESLEVECSDGSLSFTCPDFTGDLAVKMSYRGTDPPVGIEDPAQSGSTVPSIYPNPVNTWLNIDSPEQLRSIRLLNLAGQQVMTSIYPKNNSRIRLDLSGLTPGIYMLETRSIHGSLHNAKVSVN